MKLRTRRRFRWVENMVVEGVMVGGCAAIIVSQEAVRQSVTVATESSASNPVLLAIYVHLSIESRVSVRMRSMYSRGLYERVAYDNGRNWLLVNMERVRRGIIGLQLKNIIFCSDGMPIRCLGKLQDAQNLNKTAS